MPKFQIKETIHSHIIETVRLGPAGAANAYGNKEVGKAVKLAGDSQYNLCALGDPVEAVISSSELEIQGTVDTFAIGGIRKKGYKEVTFDGTQAAGTGAMAIGDYVVVGTVTAKGTALPGPLRVRTATNQATAQAAVFKARVVSLGTGAGAVGTVGIIEML